MLILPLERIKAEDIDPEDLTDYPPEMIETLVERFVTPDGTPTIDEDAVMLIRMNTGSLLHIIAEENGPGFIVRTITSPPDLGDNIDIDLSGVDFGED